MPGCRLFRQPCICGHQQRAPGTASHKRWAGSALPAPPSPARTPAAVPAPPGPLPARRRRSAPLQAAAAQSVFAGDPPPGKHKAETFTGITALPFSAVYQPGKNDVFILPGVVAVRYVSGTLWLCPLSPRFVQVVRSQRCSVVRVESRCFVQSTVNGPCAAANEAANVIITNPTVPEAAVPWCKPFSFCF